MIEKSKTILFFGTDSFSLTILKSLYNAGYNIAAIITKPDSISGRGHKVQPSVVKIFGINHNIPVWQPNHVRDLDNILSNIPIMERVGILASYGKIIPESTLKLFSPGIINVHPSLLPKYRGSTPIESAILNGDSKTGISIMALTPEMDAGPIYYQSSYTISADATQPLLYEELANLGANNLISVLPKIISGAITPKNQDDTKATYCKPLQKSEKWLDAEKIKAAEAERKIRAHLLFPKTAYTININGQEIDLIITKAHVTKTKTSPLDIMCSDKKYLSIDEVIAPSGRTMNRKSFENGYLK